MGIIKSKSSTDLFEVFAATVAAVVKSGNCLKQERKSEFTYDSVGTLREIYNLDGGAQVINEQDRYGRTYRVESDDVQAVMKALPHFPRGEVQIVKGSTDGLLTTADRVSQISNEIEQQKAKERVTSPVKDRVARVI